MARFCSKCNKKFGFFEEDYDGMCKSCYEENLRKIEEERRKKEKEEKEEKERIRKQRKEQKRKQEEKEKIEEQKRQEKKEHKKELLKNILINNPMLLDRLNNMINMIPFCTEDALKKEKTYKNDGYLAEILFEILIWIYSKIPDKFSIDDIDSINNYEMLKKARIDLKDFFKSTFDKNTLDFIDINKNYNENKKVCNYTDCEMFLFGNGNIYIFHEIQMKEDSYWSNLAWEDSDELVNAGKNLTKFILNKRDACNNMCRLIFFKEIFSYAVTLFYGIIFCRNISVIENNEEINKIYNNLINTTDDSNYIAKKLFEMYENFYKDLFEINMNINKFESLLYLLKWKKSYDFKYLDDVEYNKLIDELKKENNSKNKTQKIVKKIEESNLSEQFVEIDNPSNLSSGYKIVLIDTLNRVGKSFTYNDLFYFLKTLYTNADEIASCTQKLSAIKEKERLLNGDMSKEIKKEQLEVDYSNVQNGYEFEQYVADLYKKLGYKIEEVTKKSGDQRC